MTVPHPTQEFIHQGNQGNNVPRSDEYVEFESKLPPDPEQALRDIR
jgi:hypothetical protein